MLLHHTALATIHVGCATRTSEPTPSPPLRDAQNESAVLLGTNQTTSLPVNEVVSKIQKLRSDGFKILVVFDNLTERPDAKADTNKKRAESRAEQIEFALAHVHAGSATYDSVAKKFKAAVKPTPEIFLSIAKWCKDNSVAFMFSPKEADSQVAYLAQSEERAGRKVWVWSIDGDMIPYGVPHIITSIDMNRTLKFDVLHLEKLYDPKFELRPSKTQKFIMQPPLNLDRIQELCCLLGSDYGPPERHAHGVGAVTAVKLFIKFDKLGCGRRDQLRISGSQGQASTTVASLKPGSFVYYEDAEDGNIYRVKLTTSKSGGKRWDIAFTNPHQHKGTLSNVKVSALMWSRAGDLIVEPRLEMLAESIPEYWEHFDKAIQTFQKQDVYVVANKNASIFNVADTHIMDLIQLPLDEAMDRKWPKPVPSECKEAAEVAFAVSAANPPLYCMWPVVNIDFDTLPPRVWSHDLMVSTASTPFRSTPCRPPLSSLTLTRMRTLTHTSTLHPHPHPH